MTTFTIEATFGDQMVRSQASGDIVDAVVKEWSDMFSSMDRDKARAEVRHLIVEALMNERHKNDLDQHRLLSGALVWMTATGSLGEKLVPLMRKGGPAIGYDITRIGPTSFNFRLLVDEKTQAAIAQ